MGQCLTKCSPRRVLTTSIETTSEHNEQNGTINTVTSPTAGTNSRSGFEPIGSTGGKWRELIAIPAGRRPVKKNDDYVLIKYNRTVDNIRKSAGLLNDCFLKILETYRKADPITNDIMNFRMIADTIGREYEEFFRDSSWKIDKYVQDRKDIATKGYEALTGLKDSVDSLKNQLEPDFDESQRRLDYQIKMAEELATHFYSTFEKDGQNESKASTSQNPKEAPLSEYAANRKSIKTTSV